MISGQIYFNFGKDYACIISTYVKFYRSSPIEVRKSQRIQNLPAPKAKSLDDLIETDRQLHMKNSPKVTHRLYTVDVEMDEDERPVAGEYCILTEYIL